jgi:uncharacterized protein (TIGR02722 family)
MRNLLLASAALALAGCQPKGAAYVDPAAGAGVVSLDQINIQDFGNAADGMLQSLYDSPAFAGKKAKDGGAPILMVGRVRNDTAGNFDTDLLVKRMTVSVTRSGKARVAKAAGFGGAEDAAAAEARKAAAQESGVSATPLIPDYTLSGKIIEVRAQAGSTRQTSYVFQLSLTEVKTGLAVWEEEKQITKQGKRSTVGF